MNKKEQLLQVIQTPSNVQDAGGLTVNKADGQRPMDNYERMDWFHDATFYKIVSVLCLSQIVTPPRVTTFSPSPSFTCLLVCL